MPRLTIEVSDALAESLRQHPGFDVSAVCQDALESEVARWMTPMERETVAWRVRETRDDVEVREERRGRELGAQWARSGATATELHEASRVADERLSRWELPKGHSLAGWLGQEEGIERRSDGTISLDARTFYVRGILEGAQDVLNQIVVDIY